MKALVIVAHPDDETIWSGGLILQHPDWDWTILSLCRAEDPDRGPKFKKVCEYLKAVGIMSDLDDSPRVPPIDPERDIGTRIMAAVGEGPWELCLTHGQNGEYGHPRHKEVHSEVLRLAAEGTLPCGELWTFAYDCDSSTGVCRPASWADRLVELSQELLVEKKRLVHERYGYGKDSFEVKACISPEAFQQVKRVDKEIES
jgi:hypothetical protein